MEKIKRFSLFEIESIKKFLISKNSEVALVNCNHMGTYQSKVKCPKCNKRWKRLPNKDVFKELTELYEASDVAWATIFGTDRSSVSRLRELINPKTKKPIWNQERYEIEVESNNGYIDRQPIEDFLLLLEKFPKSNIDNLLKVAGINKYYFQLVKENDTETRDRYNNLLRLHDSLDTEYLYCSSCKIRKRSKFFKKLGQDKTPAKVCKICIRERDRNKFLLDNNKETSLKIYHCKECGKDFEVDLSKDENYIFCKEHRED